MTASDIPWIGEIPAHWSTVRLKWTVGSSRSGTWGAEPDGENDLLCVRVADFDRERFKVTPVVPTLRAISQSERRNKMLRRSDLLLEKSGGGELQPVGAVVLYDSDVQAVCSNFIARLTSAPGYEPRYLCYLHAALYATKLTVRSIKQTTGIQNLDTYSYFSEVVPSPPLDEQRAIADFLDRETARIDELIAKEKHLLDCLVERDIAIRVESTLRGCNPDVAYRESGFPWIGTIPVSWTMTSLKHVCNVNYGISLELDRTLLDGVKIISLPNVTLGGDLELDDVPFAPRHLVTSGDLLHRGDLLFNWRNGSSEHVGKTALFDSDCEFTHVSFLLRLRPKPTKSDSRYLQMLLFALRMQGLFGASKAQVNRTYNRRRICARC